MGFLIALVCAICVIVVVAGVVAVAYAYLMALMVCALIVGAAGFLWLLYLGIVQAGHGDYTLLVLACIAGFFLCVMGKLSHDKAEAAKRLEAENAAKAAAAQRLEAEQARLKEAIRVAKAGPIETWVRGWFR